MATNSRPFMDNPVYIHELPFKPRRQLCRILDADRKWEDLGGLYMGYDITTLELIGQAILRDRSPTGELLNKWGQTNGTIQALFMMLEGMNHQRAMAILLPYVHEKYHGLLKQENSVNFSNYSKTDDLPRPSLLELSNPINTLSNPGALPKPSACCQHIPSSKIQNDVVNMNQNFSSLLLHSKMNSLNAKNGNLEQNSPDSKVPKRRSQSGKEDSVSDNCLSAKLKNARKQSLPNEILLNGKYTKQSSACAANIEEPLPDIMQVPFKDILRATDDFNKNRILGRGGFGVVYRGDWKGTSVAIKRLTAKEGQDSASRQMVNLKQSRNELKILKVCRFDHILPLYGVSLDGVDPCLVYQLMVNGSLEDRLLCRNNTAALTWSQRSHIAECTTKGLNYLHTTLDKPLVHGDIKSANILLDGNMDAKIGDFGLTREGPGVEDTHVKVSRLHGTECYLPPEYLRHRQLSPSVDIFSYGIVLLEMATGLRPFDAKRGEAKKLVDYVSDCSSSGRLESLRDLKAGEEQVIWFRELLKIGQRCSRHEKKKRPPMNEVLEQFQKVKQEMTVMDKIRRLSNDKGNTSKAGKLSLDAETAKLSPIEIQLFYDMNHPADTASKLSSEFTSEFSEDNSVAEPFEAAENGGPAPLPLLTVLQLQISDLDQN